MNKSLRYELKWLGIILLISIAIVGIVTRFKFIVPNVPNHDTYLVLPVYYLFLFLYIFLSIIVLGVRESKYKFKRKKPLIILLIYNTFAIVTTGLIMYAVYTLFLYRGLIDYFFTELEDNQKPMLELIKYVGWIGITIFITIISFMIFLSIKLRAIYRKV